MKSGEKYFVRIDEKVNSTSLDDVTRKAHFDYLNQLSNRTKMFAGGFENTPGGMIIFVAKDHDHAEVECRKDPVIEKGFYRYQLYEWTVQLLTEKT